MTRDLHGFVFATKKRVLKLPVCVQVLAFVCGWTRSRSARGVARRTASGAARLDDERPCVSLRRDLRDDVTKGSALS